MARIGLAAAIGALAVLGAGACGDDGGGADAGPSAWSSGPSLPGGRLEPSVVALDGALIVVGGFDDGIEVTPRVDELAVADGAGAWVRADDAPLAFTHGNLAAHGGALYLLGGLTGTDFVADGAAAVRDPDGSWRALAAQPVALARGAAAIAVAPDATPPSIYLAGGATTDAAVATVLAYDVDADAWRELPPLPSPRSHAVAALGPDGELLVIGGTATLDASQPLDEVWALPPGGDTWESRASMPTARGGCAAAVVAELVLCAGGEAGPSALRAVEAYDPVADRWLVLEDLPVARAGTAGAAIADHLYIPGGAHRLRYEPEPTLAILDVPTALADAERASGMSATAPSRAPDRRPDPQAVETGL